MRVVSEPEFSRRHRLCLCVAAFCENKTRKRETLCAKCTKRKQKNNNPLAYHFNALKGNARRRGKFFSLTLSEFKLFCDKTNYLQLKGSVGNKFSIDRIDPDKGYSIDNIQMLTLADNTRKQWIDNKIKFGSYHPTEEEISQYYSSQCQERDDISRSTDDVFLLPLSGDVPF